MAKATKRDAARKRRIREEIVVDAHDSDECAMGWYTYLQDTLQFPFTAHCCKERASSPLRPDDEIDVMDLADADDCQHEMLVTIRWDRKSGLAVPLSQLKPASDTDEATRTAVADWHYWVKQGYEF